MLQTAERARIPVVGFVESGGARMQEGTAALGGYGRIFRHTVGLTGVVPQISVVSGSSAGGGAYSPALTDLILMTEDAAMFLTGPGVVREALGEEIDAAGLGGPHVHDRNGVCHLVEADVTTAAARVRELLGFLPSASGETPPVTAPMPPAIADPGSVVPAEPRRVYDVRDALAGIVDAGSLLELQPRWGRNVVTALARLDGRPVAIVANQPRHLGGVLDAVGSEKAARFVNFCDSFGAAADRGRRHPGVHAGLQAGAGRRDPPRRLASAGVRGRPRAEADRDPAQVIRRRLHHDELPRPGRRPGARLARRRARDHERAGSGGIVNRRDLRAARRPRRRSATAWPPRTPTSTSAREAAAAAGFVDEIVEPVETRERLAWALRALARPRS